MSYSAEKQENETQFDDTAYQLIDNTAYYLLSKDTEVEFVEDDGMSFKYTFDARSFVTIDEDEGVVEFAYGYFGHIKGSNNYSEYDPGCLVDVDKLKKFLVPITREQYDLLRELKDAADEEACNNEQAAWNSKSKGLSDGTFTSVTIAAKRYTSECDKIFEQNGIDITQVNNVSDKNMSISNEDYYLAYKDIMVKFVTETGDIGFEDSFDARTLVVINEETGEVEIDNGFFCNFKEFDYASEVPDKLGNIDEIKEALVPITREQYESLMVLEKEYYDDTIFSDDETVTEHYDRACDKILEQNGIVICTNNVEKSLTTRFDNVLDVDTKNSEKCGYERRETMSYYNKEEKTGSHVKMSLTPKSDIKYYLTHDSVDFKFTSNQNVNPVQFVPSHSLLTINEANGTVSVYDGVRCNYKTPVALRGLDTWDPFLQDGLWYLNNIDEVKAVTTEISKEQYERLCPMFKESGISRYTPSDAYDKYLKECDKVIEQNTPKMQYYLTDRDVRLHYFDGNGEHRMVKHTELPKHTVVAVDAANKAADYVGYDVLKEWSEGTPDFVNLCDIKAMSHEISKEQYDMLFDLESRSQECNVDYNKQMYECIANEMKGDEAGVQTSADKLMELKDVRHSVENEYATKLESVLDSFGKSNIHLTDTFAGQINKYGVDIDFTKIHSVNVAVPSDIYVGGMDENGHEARDNFRHEVDTISFQIDQDTGELCVCESEWGDCGNRISTRQALEKISDYLDEAARDSNVSLYVKQNDGKTKPIAPILADKQTSKPVSRKMAMLTGLAKEREDSTEATNDYSFG